VPLNCDLLLNGLAAMRYADNLQIVAVRSLERWDDCHSLSHLRQSKQRVRCATLQQNIRLDVYEAASCVEQPPDAIPMVQQKQWIRGKAADIYETRMPRSRDVALAAKASAGGRTRLSKRGPSCLSLMPKCTSPLCPAGMEFQHNYALDIILLEGQCFANETLNIGSRAVSPVPLAAMRTPTR